MSELVAPTAPVRDPSRARVPDEEGFVERDGVRVFFELYDGPGPETVVLLPPWSIARRAGRTARRPR